MVAKKIKATVDNKSYRVGEIPRKLLMETVEQISIPLARVINLSLKKGVVPFERKGAIVKTLFRKDLINKSYNYYKGHMVVFLGIHKSLNLYQYELLKAGTCLTNMLCFLKEITKLIDEGSSVDINYLDFQKQFYKVPQERLLLSLRAHGINRMDGNMGD